MRISDWSSDVCSSDLLARRLGEGKLTFYENAYILHTAPIFLIGTTISTAAFPRLNDRLAQGRSDLFRRDFLRILRVIIRSEGRRVGKACGSTCRSRCSPYP